MSKITATLVAAGFLAAAGFSGASRAQDIDEVVKLIIARRNVITFQHEQLYSAHAVNLQGFQLFADGMPRLAHAYLSAS